MTRVFVGLIRLYQWTLSPLLGSSCRYIPSCSTYMVMCIERFGVLKGVLLGMKRLAKCHPFSGFGYDPPPPALSSYIDGHRHEEP